MNDNTAETQMRKGMLVYCVLLLCKDGKIYTSELIRALRDAELIVVEGTLYPLLNRLAKDGLLAYQWQESEQGPPRKYYWLTAEGQELLGDLKSHLSQVALLNNFPRERNQRMNEVTKIHLGRQPFNISVAAHKALRTYIDAITNQVGDEDVVEEVELRMAELLAEHGVAGDKVILIKDVDYLKKNLGDPKDFKESDEDAPGLSTRSSDTKRLFRDTDNAMVAGVAAGLSNYFGVDALLIRVLFVIGTLAWGTGILLYIVLWLLVPEAKTSSEKLRMAGLPVTVDSLKEVVERADVKGAAKRANGTVAPVVNSIFRIILKIIGVGFVLAGLSAIFGLIAVGVYMAAHHGQLIQENLFPVGTTEHVLADLGLALAGVIAIFVIVCGVAVFKRRWPIKGWVTGVLAALFLMGLAVALALTAGAAPKVRDRYLSRSHTQTRSLQPFQDIALQGKDVDYQWEYADTYSVSFHYFDNPDISKIKTTVSNDLLTIDTSQYQRERHCDMLCLFPAYNLLITVKGPQPLSVPMPAGKPTHLIPEPYQN